MIKLKSMHSLILLCALRMMYLYTSGLHVVGKSTSQNNIAGFFVLYVCMAPLEDKNKGEQSDYRLRMWGLKNVS